MEEMNVLEQSTGENVEISFKERVQNTLDDIGFAYFTFDESEEFLFHKSFTRVEDYALEHELFNTMIALYAVRGIYSGTYTSGRMIRNGKPYKIPYLIHCLSVCKIMMDLEIPLSQDELDIVMASALCHGLIANIYFVDQGREMISIYHLDPRIFDIMSLVSKRKFLKEEDREKFFECLQEDKLALLVRLADRSNFVEQLYNIPIWRAREYIHETRTYYFPMCFYAKERYPELIATFTMFLGKMRSLLEVTEIMVGRFEEREIELTNEILALKEENLRLSGIIKRKKSLMK